MCSPSGKMYPFPGFNPPFWWQANFTCSLDSPLQSSLDRLWVDGQDQPFILQAFQASREERRIVVHWERLLRRQEVCAEHGRWSVVTQENKEGGGENCKSVQRPSHGDQRERPPWGLRVWGDAPRCGAGRTGEVPVRSPTSLCRASMGASLRVLSRCEMWFN